MNDKKKRNRLAGAMNLLIGAVCALVLGAVFYGAMAYQLADDGVQAAQTGEAGEVGALLALSGAKLLSEQTLLQRYGGRDCTAVVRLYQLESGTQAEAITAQPAAYIERMSEEGWTPQLITGFVLDGMEAVYALRGDEALLCAREADTVYMIRAQEGEEAMYALGAAAYLN